MSKSMFNHNVILPCKRVKFPKIFKSGACFRLSKNQFSLFKCNFLIVSNYDVTMKSRNSYDTHLWVMINYVKYNACTSSVSKQFSLKKRLNA